MKAANHRYDIAYVGFLFGHGGDALQMLQLADGVQRRGARVRIVVPANEHTVTFERRCAELGVACERSRAIEVGRYQSRQRLVPLLRMLRSLDAPVVHVHTGNSVLPRMAMLAIRLLRLRGVVVTVHSPFETVAADSRRARLWAATARRLVAVVCPSEHARRFQLRCGVPEASARVVRNAVDLATVAHGDGARAREVLGFVHDEPIVLFCSRLDEQKRPVDAVRIFAAAAADFPDARLVFLGSGEFEDRVCAEAVHLGLAERVVLTGYRTDVVDFLAAATVWLLPTERENFSIAVLEALAAGCPVLATHCPGNDEVLVDDDNARTFPVGDVATAGSLLRALLADPAQRARLGARARETARSYSVDAMVDRYAAIYAEVPGAPPALWPPADRQDGDRPRRPATAS